MANQLNIKSEDGWRLAVELAALTGESLTTAVTEALRDRLERERRARDRALRLDFGDCLAYALAKTEGEMLLFTGEDFARADIEPACKES